MENIISIFMVLFLIVVFSLIAVFFAVQVCLLIHLFIQLCRFFLHETALASTLKNLKLSEM